MLGSETPMGKFSTRLQSRQPADAGCNITNKPYPSAVQNIIISRYTQVSGSEDWTELGNSSFSVFTEYRYHREKGKTKTKHGRPWDSGQRHRQPEQ